MYSEFMINLQNCKNGYVYKISSRNLRYGVFNKNFNGFVGIREKYNDFYLFIEFHYDLGEPFGTVCPEYEVAKCPINEPYDETNEILFKWFEQFEKDQSLLIKRSQSERD